MEAGEGGARRHLSRTISVTGSTAKDTIVAGRDGGRDYTEINSIPPLPLYALMLADLDTSYKGPEEAVKGTKMADGEGSNQSSEDQYADLFQVGFQTPPPPPLMSVCRPLMFWPSSPGTDSHHRRLCQLGYGQTGEVSSHQPLSVWTHLLWTRARSGSDSDFLPVPTRTMSMAHHDEKVLGRNFITNIQCLFWRAEDDNRCVQFFSSFFSVVSRFCPVTSCTPAYLG